MLCGRVDIYPRCSPRAPLRCLLRDGQTRNNRRQSSSTVMARARKEQSNRCPRNHPAKVSPEIRIDVVARDGERGCGELGCHPHPPSGPRHRPEEAGSPIHRCRSHPRSGRRRRMEAVARLPWRRSWSAGMAVVGSRRKLTRDPEMGRRGVELNEALPRVGSRKPRLQLYRPEASNARRCDAPIAQAEMRHCLRSNVSSHVSMYPARRPSS